MSAPKIIILSDGTGNAASSVWRTNVWRMFQSLDLRGSEQAAKYDDGVGTSSFVPLAIIGGAFGYGLKRNILDAYKFICRNYDYERESKIFLFGFSRGAFTARVLAAFILDQGLVQTSSESELHNAAVKAYRAYRSGRYHSISRIEVLFRTLRDYLLVPVVDTALKRKTYSELNRRQIPAIEFIGVWDTVAAYGLPIDEMTRGINNWIWPLELPNRVLNERVNFARHALALDDERTTFHPVLWTEDGQSSNAIETINGERLVQVWFAGMHANVGGGYPDDALAFVPLYWMMKEAQKCGLSFKTAPEADPDSLKLVGSSEDKDGRLYDSRAGLGSYYRYGPRPVHDLCNDPATGVHVAVPKIHESVFSRIDSGANAYAPITLPPQYVVVKDNGDVVSFAKQAFETEEQARRRFELQERLWNYVWLRRLTYFATLAATFHLLGFFFFHDQNKTHEFDTRFRMVSEAVRLVESFLPSSLHWWTDWYAANPEWLCIGILAVIALIASGSSLEGKIRDGMRIIWGSQGSASPSMGQAHEAIYWLRTTRAYRALIRFGKRQALPFLFVLSMIWLVGTGASHFIFNAIDSMGAFCKGTETVKLTAVDKGIPQAAKVFDTSSVCEATGLTVRAGFRYEIVVIPQTPWQDGLKPTTPNGYRTSTIDASDRWKGYSTILLRRILFRPWYRIIARVGQTGVDEYFLDPVPVSRSTPQAYKATFTAQRSGELFLYVNDAVIAFPWFYDYFYRDNSGTADVTVRLL